MPVFILARYSLLRRSRRDVDTIALYHIGVCLYFWTTIMVGISDYRWRWFIFIVATVYDRLSNLDDHLDCFGCYCK